MAASVGVEKALGDIWRLRWEAVSFEGRNMVMCRGWLDVRVGRLLSLLLFREIYLVCRWKSAGGVLTEDPGPGSGWSLQLFVHSFILRTCVRGPLCARHCMRLWG